jgi:hypothetical protein
MPYWHFRKAYCFYQQTVIELYRPFVCWSLQGEDLAAPGGRSVDGEIFQRLLAAASAITKIVSEALVHNREFLYFRFMSDTVFFYGATIHVLVGMLRKHDAVGSIFNAHRHLTALGILSGYSFLSKTMYVPNLRKLLRLIEPHRGTVCLACCHLLLAHCENVRLISPSTFIQIIRQLPSSDCHLLA